MPGNVISGNYGNGISFSLQAVGNFVEGNLIGTNKLGLSPIPNLGYGINLTESYNNTIGGTTTDARNVISGNMGSGIIFEINSNVDYVEGNFIGTDISGTNPLPNSGDGIDLEPLGRTIT